MKVSDSGTDSDSGSSSSSSSDSDSCSSESSIDYDVIRPPDSKRQCRQQPSRSCNSDFKRLYSALEPEAAVVAQTIKPEPEKPISSLLKSGIIQLSQADNWQQAKQEWSLLYIYSNKNKVGYCVCKGKKVPIHLVRIRNRKTHHTAVIDKECLRSFQSFRLHVDPDSWIDLDCLELAVDYNHSVGDNFLWLACKSKVIQRWEVLSYIKISKNLDEFNPQHRDFCVEYYQWRLIVNARLRYGFHRNRPHCDCAEDVFAVPKFSTADRPDGDHNDFYFYACPKYKNDEKPGCNFYKICAHLSA